MTSTFSRLASFESSLYRVEHLHTAADDGDEEDSSGSKKPGGKFLQFMEEVGEDKVKNPDTGNQVKVKSLNGPKGRKWVQKQFQKWLKKLDDIQEGNRTHREKMVEFGKKDPEVKKTFDGTRKRTKDRLRKISQGALNEKGLAAFKELKKHLDSDDFDPKYAGEVLLMKMFEGTVRSPDRDLIATMQKDMGRSKMIRERRFDVFTRENRR